MNTDAAAVEVAVEAMGHMQGYGSLIIGSQALHRAHHHARCLICVRLPVFYTVFLFLNSFSYFDTGFLFLGGFFLYG